MTDPRTNKADVLLQHTQRYQSGRLTIFLGAARAWERPLPCWFVRMNWRCRVLISSLAM